MDKSRKKLLGVATFWPLIYMFLFFVFIFAAILLAPGGGGDFGGIAGLLFVFLMVLHFLTIFLILGMQIYYIVHAVKNDDLTQNSKILWILGFFFGSFFAMPVYWYVAIWKAADEYEYRALESGTGFNPAYETNQETEYTQPIPRKPHSWR